MAPVQPKGQGRKRPRSKKNDESKSSSDVESKAVDGTVATSNNTESGSGATATTTTTTTTTKPEVSLTPHTLRLLKLIQDGTAEHAEMAAKQLHTITSSDNNCRPVVLWEIMGRLQSFLVSPAWNTRRNAAIALEGVAQHLPLSDQEEFLQQTQQSRDHRQQQKREGDEDDEPVSVENWLTVQDVQTNLSTILTKGRQLLATTDELYESEALVEDEHVQALTDHHMMVGTGVGAGADLSMDGKKVQGFCDRRLEIQRRILARRLGLSDALVRYTGTGRDMLKNGLTQDDIAQQQELQQQEQEEQSSNSTSTTKTKKNGTKKEQRPKKKRKRKKRGFMDDEDEDQHRITNRKLSIRELLVAQVYQQQQQQQEEQEEETLNNIEVGDPERCRSSSLQPNSSAKRPQQCRNDAQYLLAGELVYRMFDADWHVRHGSLMGIRALIRAWNVQNRHGQQGRGQSGVVQSSSNNDSRGINLHSDREEETVAETKTDESLSSNSFPTSFGCWPHDILARVLCIIALDRFCDFSGASTESTSTSVVAPIRESAAQVFAIVFLMAPESERRRSVDVLQVLLEHDEWEVRHGALLAFKYVSVLMTSNDIKNSERETNFIFQTALPISVTALEDRSDDIQSVAAQVFSLCHKKMSPCEHFDKGIKALWKAMSNLRLYSIGVPDLVRCLSDLLDDDAGAVFRTISSNGNRWQGCIDILVRLNDLLYCEYISVKTSIVVMIRSVLIHSDSLSSSADVRTRSTFDCFRALFERIFDLRLVYAVVDDSIADKAEYQLLLNAIDETWVVASRGSNLVFAENPKERSAVEDSLLMKYFGLDEPSCNTAPVVSTSFVSSKLVAAVDNAKALSIFILQDGKMSESSTEYIESSTTSTGDVLSHHDVLHFLLVAFLESPLIHMCQRSCFLIQSLCKDRHVKSIEMTPSVKSVLDDCCERLVRIQSAGAPCQRGHKSSPISQAEFLQSLNRGIQSIHQGQHVIEVLSTTLGDQMSSFPQRNSDDNSSIFVSIDSMRVTTTISGATIAMGLTKWPKKLSPLVRPLMTSIQNELEEENVRMSCMYIQAFFNIIQQQGSSDGDNQFCQTASKVLKNLCNIAAQGESSASTAASSVISAVVGKIDSKEDLEKLEELWGMIAPIIETTEPIDHNNLPGRLRILYACCQGLSADQALVPYLFQKFVPSLIKLCCTEADNGIQELARRTIGAMSLVDDWRVLETSMIRVVPFLQNMADDNQRLRACLLLKAIIDSTPNMASLCKAVRFLIPVVMPLMADPSRQCSEIAASIFSEIVVVAPIVQTKQFDAVDQQTNDSEMIIDHLIHGKPFPPCNFHPEIVNCLDNAGIVLRNYQQEGVSWLRFLQRVRLNGALCDDMGLGKTLQALLGVAISHLNEDNNSIRSLIVCPSSLVGHWMQEINRFFPGGRVFSPLALVGNRQQRETLWQDMDSSTNLLVTSYSVLRSDIHNLESLSYRYCILDEGHLLRNPKTLTAKASRRIRSRHKLILTGTPIQNTVNEVWATFDFLMPNFLGSSERFAADFAKPIIKGQKVDAPASDVALGMEKLRLLHQQVLPFILRREKEQVLKELPPKIITRIPCLLSPIQKRLYEHFCSGDLAKQSLSKLQSLVESTGETSGKNFSKTSSSAVTPEILKTLLYLRLVCTHPWLVRGKDESKLPLRDMKSVGIEMSGKLLALVTLLSEAGIGGNVISAADNDSSLLYCDDVDDNPDDVDEDLREVLKGEGGVEASLSTGFDSSTSNNGSRCLIFAQFTHSLDVVEEIVLKRHMPTTKFLRLDGRVPASKRSDIVDRFNKDENIKILLLTTRIGGLGLNLTGADTVIFLEHDWNPHADLQAADRAHRIGQTKSVRVYQLVTTDTIEEKTMKLHDKKLAMSSAIVNTDNSSMYSLGTDKLLDIFQYRGGNGAKSKDMSTTAGIESALDAMVERYKDEYQSLSIDDFLSGFQPLEESIE